MIDHRLLAFEAVLQEGGFERAARRLALTQSAVSQRVKLLEAELGQVLLVRSKPVRPTPAGRRLLPYLAQLRLMEAEARRALSPRQVDGPLRLAVGVNADSLATWFIGAVAEVVRDEGIVLDCVVDDQDHTHALLADGEVLGCVSTRADPMRGCAAVRLGAMPYLCAGSPDFRALWFPQGLTATALARAPAIVFGHHDDMHEAFLLRNFGLDSRRYPHHVVPSSEGFMAFALAGLGYGFVPEIQARAHLARGELVDLAPEREEVVLYWHHWQVQSPVMARLAQAIGDAAGRALGGERRHPARPG
ncbi:MAG TPA: LysR family transcriptional regulator ArgP [Piscinibacter sp.]|uniref:LysR family transcriptional regulator ArgP n=1 Tax=Thauera sp. TaxID=1905334 RepID=UPI001B637B8B|nr:LysR family transcriptional regulator ArgP [Thauera sp.]HMZ30772.1 LysR family transcriptional regulator ArgP [Thauera aminoaromatica]HNK18074.1 LysR family transcriptional regulator ArgP [Piscinibacter sp.]MBP6132840.1 LysR family transcriptional regulator ArgP [Thauera sp.]MBP7047341.1 LysR family transcriptional regulator ArgP [Thauera sp.]MBX3681887.1 LysR family transcriptional regulator ArgP [Thauera sp.]